ncbi:hypothetical protein NQD34_012123, partial [Periophthalmus magnuspinnatus]
PCSLVQISYDRVAHLLQLLLLVLILFLFSLLYLVLVQPCNDLVALVHNGLLILWTDLVLQLLVLHGALHVESQRLQGILGRDFFSLHVIFGLKLLCFLHHALNILLAQTAYKC